MKSNDAFFIGFLFFDVVALGWAAWELWSIRPGKPEGAKDVAESRTSASPDDAGHPKR